MTVLEKIQEVMDEDPNLVVDAYGTAITVIRLITKAALSSGSMGVGAEEAHMTRILDAARED